MNLTSLYIIQNQRKWLPFYNGYWGPATYDDYQQHCQQYYQPVATSDRTIFLNPDKIMSSLAAIGGLNGVLIGEMIAK